MHISFDITQTFFILAGISLSISVIIILWEYYNLYILRKSSQESSNTPSLSPSSTCDISNGVSVIIYSDNNLRNLAQNLPHIISQDYPIFEIIVVNDGKNEAISDYIYRLSLDHENLHYSYTPDDARNLSRKKLALTIGIKAAKYDIILTTNSNCCPKSNKWISSIAKHFQTGTDVVIGYSHISENADTKKWNLLRYFLTLRNSIKYLTQAISRKPYRGTSDNLAYRKSLFLKNKGFSHSMHLHYGDDDIFVNEITTKENTKVEISPDSIILSHFENPERMFQTLALRQSFTERKIHSSAFVLEYIRILLTVLNICALISIIAIDYTNVISIITPIVIAVLYSVFYIIIYRKTATLLFSRKLLFSIPLFAFIRPIVNIYFNIKSRRHTAHNYTWQSLKNRI